ncbi:MAG: hypothetical protein HOW73_29515 [Polyangiaceae bacterium]|nr:hypothetical protein [Polyangiaceae bacterium]
MARKIMGAATKETMLVQISSALVLIAAVTSCVRSDSDGMPSAAPMEADARASAPPAGTQAANALEYSFMPVLKPNFDDLYHEVVVSRGGQTLQTLSMSDDVGAGELRAMELLRADFDGDGSDDLIMLPRVLERTDEPRVRVEGGTVRYWHFSADTGRFLATPELFQVRDVRKARRGAEGSMTVELLRSAPAGDEEDASERYPILIRRDGKLVQVLQTDESDTDDLGYLWFADEELGPGSPWVDANFDGQPDLVLQREHCAGNCYFAFFLFDPSLERFVHHPGLSALASPRFDSVHQEIEELESRGAGGDDHRAARYRFVDGALQKHWESDQETSLPAAMRPNLPGSLARRVVHQRIGGAMKLTCDAFVDLGTNRLVRIDTGSEASCAER